MSDYRELDFGEIAEIQTGPFGSQLVKDEYVDGGIPVITVENIKDFRIENFTYPSVTKEKSAELKRYFIEKGDIIFSRVGSVDLSALVEEEQDGWIISSRMLRARLKHAAKAEYVAYYLQQSKVRRFINAIAVGATMPSINTSILESIPIRLPPLEVQEAIAEVLSSLDDKIDLLKRQNKTLEGMAEALFRQWFIEEAQDDWEIIVLPDLCTRLGSGGTPSTTVKEYYEGEVNWFTTKELSDDFTLRSEKMITQEAVRESATRVFPKNTIMLAIYAAPTVGRLGILTSNGCFNQATCGFVARDEVGHEFIFTLLKNQRQELNQLATGTAQQNLSVKKIKDFGIPLPDVRRISEWRDICRSMFQKWELNVHEISLLESQRDTLLPKLMSGEVRVRLD
jgi:type I restriction enzyme S subunit